MYSLYFFKYHGVNQKNLKEVLKMELSEILEDALAYPLNNVKALIIYVILGVIAAIVLTFTGVGTIASFATDHWLVGGGIAVIGLIIALIIFLVIEGYCLDIVKSELTEKTEVLK